MEKSGTVVHLTHCKQRSRVRIAAFFLPDLNSKGDMKGLKFTRSRAHELSKDSKGAKTFSTMPVYTATNKKMKKMYDSFEALAKRLTVRKIKVTFDLSTKVLTS